MHAFPWQQMPECCNCIHVLLYVFFIGMLRVRRVAAGLVSFHLFRPVGLNCCCVQQTSVFQICSGFGEKALSVSIRNSHLPDFRILSQQSPVIWPCFCVAGPAEEQTYICFYTDIFLQRSLWWKWLDFASLCLSMLGVLPRWVSEQIKWVSAERGSVTVEENELSDVAINEKPQRLRSCFHHSVNKQMQWWLLGDRKGSESGYVIYCCPILSLNVTI